MNKERFLESGLLEQYALGLTSPDEDKEVEDFLQKYPEYREEIENMRRAIDQYAIDHKIPPPKLKNKNRNKRDVIRSIQEKETREPPPGKRKSSNKALPGMPPGGCLMLLLIIGLAISNALFYRKFTDVRYQFNRVSAELAISQKNLERERKKVQEATQLQAFFNDDHTKIIYLMGTNLAPNTRIAVHWNPESHQAILNVLNIPPPPNGSQYQLWSDINDEMFNLGVLDHRSNHIQPIPYLKNTESLSVTLEPSGGNQKPTVSQLFARGDL